jgi:TolB protein
VEQLQSLPPTKSSGNHAGQITTLTTALNAEIVFAWSPRGDQVAFAVRPGSDVPFYGPIHVFDTITGQTQQLTGEQFQILGFFWAPDGRRMGYLTRLDVPGAMWMQWRVFDLSEKQDRGFSAFHPAPLMRFMVHSFNQYAQSHRLWSPDGRYLVYADRDDTLTDRVWLVDTLAERGADPVFVDAGSVGVWSWY